MVTILIYNHTIATFSNRIILQGSRKSPNQRSFGYKSVYYILTRTIASRKYIRYLLPKYLRFPQITISPKRNRKGENSQKRKYTLLKKAFKYRKLSGTNIILFIY
jgi:hypothetical protein